MCSMRDAGFTWLVQTVRARSMGTGHRLRILRDMMDAGDKEKLHCIYDCDHKATPSVRQGPFQANLCAS
jgi:hypothetical protein